MFEAIVASLELATGPRTLPSPAVPQELDELEAMIGFPLPADFRALYSLHDGEFAYGSTDLIGLFCGYEFLSLRHVRDLVDRLDWTRLYWAKPGVTDPTEYRSVPAGAVRAAMVERGWLPFAGFYSGNHLGVDLNPGPTGVFGQVINFGPDDEVHFQVATSLGGFMQLIKERYASKRWHSAFEGSDWSLYDTLRRERT